MHTSRSLRTDAKKVFFSDPEAWYCVEADWLLEGGHAGHTRRDLDFLACVERLYIEYERLYEATYCIVGGPMTSRLTMEGVQEDEGIRGFWRTVRGLFPRVKHVCLWEEHARVLPSSSSDEHKQLLPPEIFIKVASMCPLDEIHFSITLLFGD
jgi:hypothetical protein